MFDLTLREAEVCRDLLGGMAPTDIAAASGRSVKTVRNQVQAVHDKLDVDGHRSPFDRLSAFRAVSHVFGNVEDDPEPAAHLSVGRDDRARARREARPRT